MFEIPTKKWDLLLRIGDYYMDSPSLLAHSYKGDLSWQDAISPAIPCSLYSKLLIIGAEHDEIKGFEKLGYKVKGFGIQENPFSDIDYTRGDMHNMPFPPSNFDAVVSRGTFEHGHAPWLQVLEIRRVLRNQGRVVLEIPFWNPTEMNYHHTMLLHPIQMIKIFEHLCFRQIHVEYWSPNILCFQKNSIDEFKFEPRFKQSIEEYEKL